MAAQYSSYISKIWAQYATFHLRFLPSKWSGWRITIGFWFRATRNELIVQNQTITTGSSFTAYEPLPDGYIRLLLLQPGEYSDSLVGDLVAVELDSSKETYTALSYVWGGRTGTATISLNKATMQILPNLDEALRHLRSTETTQRLWVDAVCINQEDIRERSTQVPLMTEIYSWSKMVHCWLGDSTRSSATGIEILSYLASDLPFDDGTPWKRSGIQEVRKGLQDILERAWFQRIWVVQEAALAPYVKMQVGDLCVDWNREEHSRLFLARIKLLEVSPSWRASGGNEVDMRPIRELLEQSVIQMNKQVGRVQDPTFLDVVHAMRFRNFTDSRDSIYGVMGLVTPAEVAGFTVDYGQTWERTYNRFYDHALRTAIRNPGEKW